MTEQVRLTGDRPIELDRISHQYLLWEEAQDEFRKYQEMYRTAEELARSR